MRTTLRKRNLSSSNPRNTSPRRFKKRKLTPMFNNDDSNLSLSQTELESLHNQLLALKHKHISKQTNTQTSKPKANTNHKPKQKPTPTNTSQHTSTSSLSQPDINSFLEIDDNDNQNQNQKHVYGPPIKTPKNTKAQISKAKAKPKRKAKHKTITEAKIDNNQKRPTIQKRKNENVSINPTRITSENHDDWEMFIDSTPFNHKHTTHKSKHKSTDSKMDNDNKCIKTDLISKATATESEWLDFLDTRYQDNNERDDNWKPPEVNTFWDQGPIGMVQSWWNDNEYRKYVNDKEADLYIAQEKERKNKKKVTKSDINKKKRDKLIKQDIMKELKAQRLEMTLKKRIEKGELVKNLDTSDNAFESFFDSVLEMGNDMKNNNGLLTKEEIIQEKKQRKTKIFRPKLKSIKKIATFENDDLFFFEESENESDDEEVMGKINENDMIYLNENSIGKNIENMKSVSVSKSAMIAAKVNSENILLEQRTKMQHEEMMRGNEEMSEDLKGRGNGNKVVNANILSDTVEDSMKEKRILKKLNVMDYVYNYKNVFFREVQELGLRPGVLVDNWEIIKKHEGLSRKLRKKLGIIMARERVRREKRCKMERMIDEMVNEESVSDDTDDMIDVCAFVDD